MHCCGVLGEACRRSLRHGGLRHETTASSSSNIATKIGKQGAAYVEHLKDYVGHLEADVNRLEGDRQWWQRWHIKWGPFFRLWRDQ